MTNDRCMLDSRHLHMQARVCAHAASRFLPLPLHASCSHSLVFRVQSLHDGSNGPAARRFPSKNPMQQTSFAWGTRYRSFIPPPALLRECAHTQRRRMLPQFKFFRNALKACGNKENSRKCARTKQTLRITSPVLAGSRSMVMWRAVQHHSWGWD